MTCFQKLALALASTAMLSMNTPVAGAAPTYSGEVKGVPGSQFEMTFDRHSGKLYVDQYRWGPVERQCDGGTESYSLQGGFDPPDGRVRHRTFRVRRESAENNFIFLFAGELRREGKAKGVLRNQGEGFDEALGVCDTGKLEWKATRN